MNPISIKLNLDKLKEHKFNEETILLTKVNPLEHRLIYKLKNYKFKTNFINSGTYRLTLLYMVPNKSIDIEVEYFNKKFKKTLYCKEGFYFNLIDKQISEGNEEDFNKNLQENIKNINKRNIFFWNTYWKLLHTVCFHYPEIANEKNKKDILNLVENMKKYISCSNCRSHFKNYIRDNPIEEFISCQKDLFKYFFDFHNDVNRRLNKTQMILKVAKHIYVNEIVSIKDNLKINVKELIEENKIHTIAIRMNNDIRVFIHDFYKNI